MLRRLTAFLTALLLLSAPLARAAEIGDLAILSQWDERFQTNDYRYNNNYFRFGGCGPASVANGLIAALDVTDQELAAGILYDALRVVANIPPSRNRMQINRLRYLNFTAEQISAGAVQHPSLSAALQAFGGSIRYHEGYLTPEKLEQFLAGLNGEKAILHGSLTGTDRWAVLCEMIRTLLEAGYDDARLVVSYLGAGTEDNQSPFRSGTAGHYLSICVPLDTFCETGSFFVLDSMPRALFDEPYGPDEAYAIQYDFVIKVQKPWATLTPFNQLFSVERVQPTIVEVVPKGESSFAVLVAGEKGIPTVDAIEPYLSRVVQFHGSSHLFIVLPER